MATRIGCDNLVYAIMVTQDDVSTAPVYGTIKSAPGVLSVNINPNASQETLFADDGPMETASTLGKIDVEIKKNELTSQNKADLLGNELDVNGAVVCSGNDIAPWVAIGFRTIKSNGNYRYVWLYKGKFMEPEDNNETKGDKVTFNSETIKGQFVKLAKAFTLNGKPKNPWKYEIDADSLAAAPTTIANWFSLVLLPGASAATTAAAALTVVYAAGTVQGTTKATITGSAAGGNSFVYKISNAPFATPSVGAAIVNASAYTSAANIVGVDATSVKYVAIYEINSTTFAAVKFATHTVLVGEIMA